MNELSEEKANLYNLSTARDTQTMISLLKSTETTWNALDAGTVFRFLTAFLTISGKKIQLIGSERMQERPIAELVNALRSLGAKIHYLNKENYPPLEIDGSHFLQTSREIDIRGDISSQFISALLMIAPVLPLGLTLNLVGKISSLPYIEMTLNLMQQFGLRWYKNGERQFEIPHQNYKAPNSYTVESDWSAASYWYSVVALAKDVIIELPHLYKNSLQGDSKIAEFMTHFGVETEYLPKGVRIFYKEKKAQTSPIFLDFTHQPDLAQTIIVVAAAQNIPLHITGLHSLRLKETDRIAALQKELQKFGVELKEDADNTFYISGKFAPSKVRIETYEDHRMAMAFAPLVFVQKELFIENPAVVAKSYPHFWKDLAKCGGIEVKNEK